MEKKKDFILKYNEVIDLLEDKLKGWNLEAVIIDLDIDLKDDFKIRRMVNVYRELATGNHYCLNYAERLCGSNYKLDGYNSRFFMIEDKAISQWLKKNKKEAE